MSAPEPRKLGDPSTAEWRAALGLPPLTEDTLSTSARLREVQADLAASQADLTRTLQERDAIGVKLVQALRERGEVERERDELAIRAADLEQVRGELQQLRLLADGYLEDIQQLESGRDELIDSLRAQRDLARAELASARQENKLLCAHLPLPDNQNGAPMDKATEWRMPVPMRLIDIGPQGRRMFGPTLNGRTLPEHDYRFEAQLPNGATVTFNVDATAEHVATYLLRDGVELNAIEAADVT